MNRYFSKRNAASILGMAAVAVAVAGCNSDAASISAPIANVMESTPEDWYQGERPILRSQADAARSRLWVLTSDGIELYDASTRRRIAQVALPDWLWVGESYACAPDLAIGPLGEAVISSNVVPTLWRVDPVTLAASKHELAIEDDAGRDIGFTALTYSAQQRAYFAVSPSQGSLWRIDQHLGRARSIPLSSSLPSTCGLAISPRSPDQRTSQGVGFCVRGDEGDWTVSLAPDQRSGYVRAGQCQTQTFPPPA